jgi:hypothetical protein
VVVVVMQCACCSARVDVYVRPVVAKKQNRKSKKRWKNYVSFSRRRHCETILTSSFKFINNSFKI